MPNIKARVGSQNVVRVLSNASAPPSTLINLTDVNSNLKTIDGMILVWDLPTQTFIMTSVIDSSSLSIGGTTFYTNTTDNILGDVDTGALQIDGGVGIAKNLSIGSSLFAKQSLFYDTGNFYSPNGVAYFDNSGKLVSGLSTESAVSTSNYILTTLEIAGIGTPVWTSTIDGGEY